MSKKLWSGRFKEDADPIVDLYNASISFDKELINEELKCSIAHARMLGRTGIISKSDSKEIIEGLFEIEKEVKSDLFEFKLEDEDIHMAVEKRLTEKIGKVAGKLHTGRSRNDQVATVIRLWLRKKIDKDLSLLRLFRKVLIDKAREHINTIAPSYTHRQPAQPIRFAHWFLAFYEMVTRDEERFLDLRKRVNISPLGSAAIVGTNFPIDRDEVAKDLGFKGITANSIDGVSSRDFIAEYLFAGAMLLSNLSRLSEDLIFYSTSEVRAVSFPDRYCTGSSIMPQKKNPDLLELLRGKSGRVVGNLISLLVVLKGLPIGYNKDLQEDKEPLFDTAREVELALEVAVRLVSTLEVDISRFRYLAERGYTTAVDIADRLVMQGESFRSSHEIVGKLVGYAVDQSKEKFSDLTDEDLDKIDPRLVDILGKEFSLEDSVDGKNVFGGTGYSSILSRINQLEDLFSEDCCSDIPDCGCIPKSAFGG